MATLRTAQEVVNHVVRALAVIAVAGSRDNVANILSAKRAHGRLVEVQTATSRWLRGVVAVVLVREAAGTDLDIVFIVAGCQFRSQQDESSYGDGC